MFSLLGWTLYVLGCFPALNSYRIYGNKYGSWRGRDGCAVAHGVYCQTLSPKGCYSILSPMMEFLFSSSFSMCIVGEYECMCLGVHVGIPICDDPESGHQPLVFFLGAVYLVFVRLESHWPGACHVGLIGWSVSPWGPLI